jgi:precorrin-8X/cobalt-precorrin-8 methylmutase
VVAIGNAPTALFHLLDRLSDWAERPAVILAFPVGFVGASESKQALIERGLDIPWVTLRGRRGGSAMAAAAVNALMVDPT